MLGKLIKYDLKFENRYLLIIHAFLISASVLIRIFLTGRIFTEGTDFDNERTIISLIIFFTVFTLLISAIGIAAQLVIAVRFYKNVFSDEGYLTHTLPVTTGELLLSKTISGCIWGILSMIMLHASLLIVTITPYTIGYLKDNRARILTELGVTGDTASFPVKEIIFLYITVCFISVLSNIVLFYISIAIGQLIYSHKVLGAIAAYFVITTVISLIMLIILILSGLLGAPINAPASFNMAAYLKDSLKINGSLSGAQAVLMYPVIYWIMKKKINLD